ncbi:cytochrome P450 [Legionella bozemanae]|uniref:cytochrome P450 n=1 Tax=Legionella bozemanae TaxID=447 RepID=UPI003EF05D1E
MLIYILFILGVGLIVRIYQLYQQAGMGKITYPSATSYLSLIKDVAFLSTNPSAKAQLQTRFMTFIAELGSRSLNGKGFGIAYFRLPDLTPVFVLTNKSAIQQLYARENEKKFGQRRFFERLALILGPDNLMSSILGSGTHSMIRQSILSRNELNRPHVASMVADFFKEYEVEQGERGKPLSEVMDKLSRRVLLTTYFGQTIIKPFEKLYQESLTKELINCLFSLDPIKNNEKKNLLLLRNRIFNLGCQIIFSSDEMTKQLMTEQSWLNYLLRVRVLMNPDAKSQLEQLGIKSTKQLTAVQCELLIKYSIDNLDTTPLSTLVRDVVNESLFIPLLGFDATATALITALRIALQDKRIYTIIKQEIQQKISANESFELHSPWNAHIEKGMSYTEAVLLEALRLLPPAPIVPEIIHETINLDVDGAALHLPPGALVFIPMQGVHTHAKHFPDIVLSSEGQRIFGKKIMGANDIFPERWGPKKSTGDFYNAHLFAETPVSYSPGAMEKEGALLTFKTGARRCPGLRIAMTEIMALFRMLAPYKFELTAEEHLELHFNYETPLQRNGGTGLLKIRPRKQLLLRGGSSLYSENNTYQIGLNFFPEAPAPKDQELEIFSPSLK